MTELMDLQYNIDEISKDVWDLNGAQERLSKQLSRIEAALSTYFMLASDNRHASAKAYFALTGEQLPARNAVEYDG